MFTNKGMSTEGTGQGAACEEVASAPYLAILNIYQVPASVVTLVNV